MKEQLSEQIQSTELNSSFHTSLFQARKIAHFLSCPDLLSAVFELKTNVIHMWHAYECGLGWTSWRLWIAWVYRVSGHRHEVRDGTNSTNLDDKKGSPTSTSELMTKWIRCFGQPSNKKKTEVTWLTRFGADATFNLTEDASVHETEVK